MTTSEGQNFDKSIKVIYSVSTKIVYYQPSVSHWKKTD